MRRLLQRQIKIAGLWASCTVAMAGVALIEAVELGWYIVAVCAGATAIASLVSGYFAWRTLRISRELPP
jgi:hypothetical protein